MFKQILLLLMSLVSCTSEKLPIEAPLANSVKNLQIKYNIQLVGFGGKNVEGQPKQDFLLFHVPERLTENYGKNLILQILNDLINELNESNKIYEYKNFEISLFNNYQEKIKKHTYPYLYSVMFNGEKFIYMYNDDENDISKNHNETESLEEALKNK